jgi:multiple sugar transport system permease protein
MEQKLYVKALKFFLIVVVTILFFFPIYWIFSMAFKPFPEWTAAGGKIYWIPNNPTFNNFRAIFARKLEMSPIAGTAVRPIINSLTVSIIGTAIAMEGICPSCCCSCACFRP